MNVYSLLAAFDNLTPMNQDNIFKALNILWQGLLAIFVVIGLIVISVKITSAIINKVQKMKKAKEEAAQNGDDQNT